MYFSSLNEVKSYVDSLEIKSLEKLMVLVGDKSENDVSELMTFLNEKNIVFFGGIYAGLLVGHKNKREGFIVQKLEPAYYSLVLPFLMRTRSNMEELRDSTAIVLVDGLSSKMKDLTDTIYAKLGNYVKYVGGGAGFYDLVHKPCLFDNKGMYEDAAIVCILKNKSEIAVEHGWEKLQGPIYVKKSYDNILSELDYSNAFEVYKHIIEEEESITLFKSDFFTYAKDHPFGILQDDGSVVVRDPISLNDDNEIVCVASIPEGSDVYVLRGDAQTLLKASERIADICTANAPEKYQPFLFDCISRAMFLEQRFEEELANIQVKLKYPMLGALSIGEIASKKSGELLIHNKSSILVLVEINN